MGVKIHYNGTTYEPMELDAEQAERDIVDLIADGGGAYRVNTNGGWISLVVTPSIPLVIEHLEPVDVMSTIG
ncbi:hypothetical protein [Microbacterium allomyrinae]|uniref:Uncharacterized protein n=1 Tax=Microbacterium allomyrinae TaxID=2830666 RepID=A0A9X1LUG7_9MICO|nr:hypothetical protein [Microbacterium allomyrinae]MCC2032200.1 hypothetical protein [Microbacterium allomyrinae]